MLATSSVRCEIGLVMRPASVRPNAAAPAIVAAMTAAKISRVVMMMPLISLPALSESAAILACPSCAGRRTSSTSMTVITPQGMLSIGS